MACPELLLCLPNNNDSLHNGETQCGPRHSCHSRCREEGARLLRGERLPGDMDIRTSLHSQGAQRLFRQLEAVVAGPSADDSPEVRDKAHTCRELREAIQRDKDPFRRGRRDCQLWRCRPGGGAYPEVGDAEGRGQMPGEASVDIIPDRPVDTRGVSEP